jgi:hypothetical protein
MGWRGAMRSIAAASRAAERDSQRRRKLGQKAKMIAESAADVEEWERYVSSLISIHTDIADTIEWNSIAGLPCPIEPIRGNLNRDIAELALAKFRPSVFHAFKGGSKKARSRLEANIEDAVARDQQQYNEALASYSKAFAEWEDDTALAKRLVRGEAAALRQVVAEMQSLSEVALVGSEVEYLIGESFVHAVPRVHGENIVPSVRRKQLASGRMSETKMPSAQFNELYQDYVASVALKAAGDLFNIIPLGEIFVSCTANMLNPQTGHKDWVPILSVHFVRDTFIGLSLSGIDPSDAMRNFRHVMNFSRSKGFGGIEPLKPIAA